MICSKYNWDDIEMLGVRTKAYYEIRQNEVIQLQMPASEINVSEHSGVVRIWYQYGHDPTHATRF